MKKQAQEFGLTGKLYTLTVLVAMSMHTVGIWILTPVSTPPLIKNIFIKGATKENSVLQCRDEFRIARDS